MRKILRMRKTPAVMTRLRAERLRRGLSQQKAAHDADISVGSVGDFSRIDSGRMRPSASQAERIARALNLSPESLQEPVEIRPVAHADD